MGALLCVGVFGALDVKLASLGGGLLEFVLVKEFKAAAAAAVLLFKIVSIPWGLQCP